MTDTKGSVERLARELAAELGTLPLGIEDWQWAIDLDGEEAQTGLAFLDYALLPFSTLEES